MAKFNTVSIAGSFFVLLIVFAIYCRPALADADIHKHLPDPWVEMVDLPTSVSKFGASTTDGISYLLSDYQIRQRPDGSETFDRLAYRIVDRSGLENGATISIEFDPATMAVTLNHLRIVRDGVAIDRLPSAKFDIFRREKDAERGLFDGWLTAYVNIEDVRAGDIIDYGKTTIRKPIVGPKLFYQSVATAWEVPIGVIREKIVWPTNSPLSIGRNQTEITPDIQNQGPDTVYSFEITDPEPIKIEENLPADIPKYPMIEFSSTSKWQAVVDAVLPHYRLDQSLPADFATKLDSIAAAYSKPEDRMIEAMRLVQDHIRYVSLSMGSGSYIPRSPSAVVESGFGDCKDKALLLASALRRLGVEADVALTDADEGLALASILPTLRAFDHVIVKAVIGSTTYWIDATNYLQGGRAENLATPAYSYALPVIAEDAAMEPIEQRRLVQPTTDVSEQFEFPANPGDALRLRVETTYRDLDADNMRYKLASQSAVKLSDDYLQYYNRQYPGMKSLQALSSEDNRDQNIVRTTELYELSSDDLNADDLIKSFPLNSDVGISSLPEPSMVGRRNPVWLGTPVFRHYNATVKNLKVRFVGPEEDVRVVTPYLAFKILWSSTQSEFRADWYLTTIRDRIPAKNVGSYLKSLKKIKNDASWSYNFGYSEAEAN